ncbi:hypothetical protein QJQ45_027622 [Haematococcus lacustris]|nr:hypothetical protein QJQ45_027622 [Haematococcus lacustris]
MVELWHCPLGKGGSTLILLHPSRLPLAQAVPFVSVATAALRELRASQPALYPAAPHCWSPALHGDSAPVVCAVCLTPCLSGQYCLYCRVVVHHSCARYMPHDCKPLALPDAPWPLHHWCPAGVTLPALAAEHGASLHRPPPHPPSPISSSSRTWAHPQGQDFRSLAPAASSPTPLTQDPLHGSSPGDPPSFSPPSTHHAPHPQDAQEHPPWGPSPPELCLVCGEPCEVGLFAMEPVWTCTWCHGLAHVLCVVMAQPAAFSPATLAALQGQLASWGSPGPGPAPPHPQTLQQQQQGGGAGRPVAAFTAVSRGERSVAAPPSSRGKLGAVGVAEPSRLGLSHRPLLVFVNLKSGPQMGATMLQQLLQLLHPLQVCELPREGPEAALRFFAALRGLRVLAIHTLSLLQQQQAALQQQQQADGAGAAGEGMGPGAPPCATPPQEGRLGLASGLQGGAGGLPLALGGRSHSSQPALAAGSWGGAHPPVWQPPPVAILPMGTGNDLARCLGWGGGLSQLPPQGLAGLLQDVAAAAPARLDRWALTVTPLLSLNNYLGVGIDAKVALEFHRIREAMPGFFRSQLGNKVWYTGIGAPDLLRRSCADLHLKLRLECDGVEVALPPDAEGLVITNIPCHMGGVYLWETGLPAPPIALPPGASPDCQAAAANLTTNRRQALADGLIEVVALGGVAHLGRLSLGLARAQRLCQCRSVALTTLTTLPMQSVGCGSLQVDGEPWLQEPAQLQLQHCSTVSATDQARASNSRTDQASRRDAQALMLRRRAGDPAQRVAAVVLEVLEASEAHGHITAAQRAALQREMAAALELL